MHILMLTACLVSTPADCAPRFLPASAAGDPAACRAGADSAAAGWIAAHPGLEAREWACVPADSMPALTVQQVAPGVHVHVGAPGPLSPENRGGIANLGFVVGTRRVAVIDPGGTREQGEQLFAAIRRVTDLPLGPVILTHMHPDHIAGAQVFAEAGAEIIADARLPAELAARRESWDHSIPAQIGTLAWAGTVLTGPTRTIDEPTTIDLGGTELTLTPVPSAHTGSDLVVRDGRSGTLFTGDLVFRELTPVIDGSLGGWLAWLASADRGAGPVVPGHGPPAPTLAEAAAGQERYLSALQAAVRAALDDGLSLSEAVPAVVEALSDQASGWADFEATTARNAAAAYAEMEWD